MKKTMLLMTAAFIGLATVPAKADNQTVVTKEVSTDGIGATTTTTTRYYYDDSDANHNGILDSDEFGNYAWRAWDRNHDGFVSADEWQADAPRWYPPGSTSYQTYTYWDKNGDGHIDPTEFNTGVTSTNMYTAWDADADKTISSDEYFNSSFRIYDTNDDGAISMAEWKAYQQVK